MASNSLPEICLSDFDFCSPYIRSLMVVSVMFKLHFYVLLLIIVIVTVIAIVISLAASLFVTDIVIVAPVCRFILQGELLIA